MSRKATRSHGSSNLRFGGQDSRQDSDERHEQDGAMLETPPENVVWREHQEKASTFNMEGMEFMRQGENDEAFQCFAAAQDWMVKAEQCCPPEELNALTSTQAAMASSLAICHKREGNQALAVRLFKKALELYESAGADLRTLVAAHLNLAACFMEADIPSDALPHSQMAVELCGQLIAAPEMAPKQSNSGEDEKNEQRTMFASGLVSLVRPDDYAMLVVAYHKSAEAHEALRQWGQATLAYTQAYEVVRRSLGPDHHLTKSFEKSARCPRKVTQPEVPLSWRLNPGGQKPLPQLPHVQKMRKPREAKDGAEMRSVMAAYLPRGPVSYKMDDSMFPSWPPPDVKGEEKQWYLMAKQDREHRRAQMLAEMRGGHQGTSMTQTASRALPAAVGSPGAVRPTPSSLYGRH